MNRGISLEEDVMRMKDEVYFLRIAKVVLVEDKSDKPFWSYTLDKFIDSKYEIFPFVNYPTFDTTGKSALIKYYSSFSDSDFIICVDSDYDYLLENPNLQKPFIFQTYTYSFENYHCFPDGIKNVLEKAVDTEGVASLLNSCRVPLPAGIGATPTSKRTRPSRNTRTRRGHVEYFMASSGISGLPHVFVPSLDRCKKPVCGKSGS